MTVRKGLLWTVLALLLGSMAAGCGKGAENSVEAPAEDPVEEERVDAEQPRKRQKLRYRRSSRRRRLRRRGRTFPLRTWLTGNFISAAARAAGIRCSISRRMAALTDIIRTAIWEISEKGIRTARSTTASFPAALQNRRE